MTDQDSARIPPVGVSEAAAKGLELRARHRKGGTTEGIARARDLKNRKPVGDRTIRKMVSYFTRHKVDKRAENFGDGENPSTGYIAWLLWGGDAGQKWAEQHKKTLEKEREEARMRRFRQPDPQSAPNP